MSSDRKWMTTRCAYRRDVQRQEMNDDEVCIGEMYLQRQEMNDDEVCIGEMYLQRQEMNDDEVRIQEGCIYSDRK